MLGYDLLTFFLFQPIKTLKWYFSVEGACAFKGSFFKSHNCENDNDFCSTMVTFFCDKIIKIENLLKDVQSKNEENIDCIETPLAD